MKFALTIILIAVLIACSNESNETITDSEYLETEIIKEEKTLNDTIRSSYPVQIGNDKGFVHVVGKRTFKDRKLVNSIFSIRLKEIKDFSISRQIDQNTLVDSNSTNLHLGSIENDFLHSASIKHIEFQGVRSNTLYFKARLENPDLGKEIIGRFNLFYRTKKKGLVYGWITDEVRQL